MGLWALQGKPMPEKTYTFRAAEEADVSDITAMHRRSITLLGRSHYTADELESWAAGLDDAFYKDALLTADLFEIALAAGGALAAISATRGHEVWLLYTDPDHAGQGIGGALLTRAEADITSSLCVHRSMPNRFTPTTVTDRSIITDTRPVAD
jgi:GNAT superfamily N-acetyltransferase